MIEKDNGLYTPLSEGTVTVCRSSVLQFSVPDNHIIMAAKHVRHSATETLITAGAALNVSLKALLIPRSMDFVFQQLDFLSFVILKWQFLKGST